MDRQPGLIAEGEQVVALEDQLAELVALRDEGSIVQIGLSHVDADQLATGLGSGVAAVSNIYSLVARDDEDLLATCAAHGMAWEPYFPLGGGGGYADLPRVVDDPVVRAVAAEVGATPTQVGIAWQLAHAPVTLVIAGTSSVDHLEENVGGGDVRLPADALARLDAV